MESPNIEAARPGRGNTGLPGAALPEAPRCAVIVMADPGSRAAAFEAATAAMADEGAASVRVGNPLNSPLTLQRILFQLDVDGGEDDTVADDEARLARLLKERLGASGRIVLVVERAETLNAAALLSLQRLASAPGAVQVLFVGAPAFWALLDAPGLAPLRQVLARQGTEPAAITPPAPMIQAIAPPVAPVRPPISAIPDRPATPAAKPPPASPARSGRRRWAVGAAGLVATAALGVAALLAPGGLFYHAVPQRGMPAPGETAGPGQPPDRPTLETQAVPQASPALPPAPRAETRMLPESARAPRAASRPADVLTDAQRDQKAEQAPSGRLRDAVPLPTPSASEGRVVIHYRGSSVAEEEAERLMAAAAPLAARVQTRVVADTPSAPVVRFFHPEDEARARQLAGVLSRFGSGWDVKNFSSFRPRPSPGTIEVWTPVR